MQYMSICQQTCYLKYKLFKFSSKLLTSLMRNYFLKWLSGAPLRFFKTIWCSRWFYPSPTPFEAVYCFICGGCCSILYYLSCSRNVSYYLKVFFLVIGVRFGWLVVLRINVDLAIFQPYLDLEAGDNQSLKIQVARPGIEPRSSCSASQELYHSATAAPGIRLMRWGVLEYHCKRL